jgi:hypothetical protein
VGEIILVRWASSDAEDPAGAQSGAAGGADMSDWYRCVVCRPEGVVDLAALVVRPFAALSKSPSGLTRAPPGQVGRPALRGFVRLRARVRRVAAAGGAEARGARAGPPLFRRAQRPLPSVSLWLQRMDWL